MNNPSFCQRKGNDTMKKATQISHTGRDRFKSASDSQSALKRTGCSSNPLQRVSHIRHRFQPVAETMTDAQAMVIVPAKPADSNRRLIAKVR
jgi:hypothetical protein